MPHPLLLIGRRRRSFGFVFRRNCMILGLLLITTTSHSEFITTTPRPFVEEKEVICSSDKMVVTLNFHSPFNGIAFVRSFFQDSRCSWPGTGSHNLLMVLPLNTESNSLCGIQYNETMGEYSVTLVISPTKNILTEDSLTLAVRCVRKPTVRDLMITLGAPSLDSSSSSSYKLLLPIPASASSSMEVEASDPASLLSLRILEGHGLQGRPVSETVVGQRLTMEVLLKNTSLYETFVHDCVAHDGSRSSEATIDLIDRQGCAVHLPRAVDPPVMVNPLSPHKDDDRRRSSRRQVYLYFYGFQFSSSEVVHFECQVDTCLLHTCGNKQCATMTSHGMKNDREGGSMMMTQESNGDLSAGHSTKLSTHLLTTTLQMSQHRQAMAQLKSAYETTKSSPRSGIACSDIALGILIAVMITFGLVLVYFVVQQVSRRLFSI